MKADMSTLFMFFMIALVILVVSVSQYQQFSLNSSNSVKLQQIDALLKNQTADLLNQLIDHRIAGQATLNDTRVNMMYIKDTNQILRQILNMTTPPTP
jgi:hypothetical protein